ncbi:MAG: hypothetical protein ABR987_16735 [Terracidiphilus sp.]|jgi:hypothetical protein
MALSKFAGQFNTLDYAYGIVSNGASPAYLVVNNGNTATGAQTVQLQFQYASTPDGVSFNPLNTNAPVTVGVGSNAETITPSSVSNSPVYGQTSFGATFANLHGQGDLVASGTVGLQEAINAAVAYGGGIVIIDAKWTALGGTQAILDAAINTLPSNVGISDNRSGGVASGSMSVTQKATLAQLLALHTVGISLVPAIGASGLLGLVSCVVDLIYGSAAFVGGGAVTVNYGLNGSAASTSNIAATVFTGLAANQIATLIGPVSLASSLCLNKALVLQAASADFTVGTGASAIITTTYRTYDGLS